MPWWQFHFLKERERERERERNNFFLRMEDKGEKSSWGFNGFSDVNGFDAASSFVDSEWASTFDEKESKKTITTSSQREEEEEEEDPVEEAEVTENDEMETTTQTTKVKMTRTQRNRQRRVREAELERMRRKSEKSLKHELHIANTISKEIDKAEKKREERKQIRNELRKEALENPNKREIYIGGKKHLHEPITDIALSDELQGSVRKMKPQGNLLKDRWYSMLERNKFELGDASLIRKMKKQQKRAHRAYGKTKWGVDHLKRESEKRRT